MHADAGELDDADEAEEEVDGGEAAGDVSTTVAAPCSCFWAAADVSAPETGHNGEMRRGGG